jgi:hypothetical protein
VLLLAMPEPQDLSALSRKLADGLVAVFVSQEEVYEGRRMARDLSNVMFTPADASGEIPWRDGFFTLVYARGISEPTPDMLRVLEPGGDLVLIP